MGLALHFQSPQALIFAEVWIALVVVQEIFPVLFAVVEIVVVQISQKAY
jgi:hypothetical protein